jgi:hypothetical protein
MLKTSTIFLKKKVQNTKWPKVSRRAVVFVIPMPEKKSYWTPFRLVFFWERTSGTAFLRTPSQKYCCLKQTSQSTSYLWHFLHASWEVTVTPFPSINVFLTVSVLAHFSKRRDKWNMWHNKEWWCLQRATNSNIQYYTDNYIATGGEDKRDEWRLIKQGVCRGCSLSPLLFIVYINSLLNKWKQTNHGKAFISRNLNLDILLFADDVILFANSDDD